MMIEKGFKDETKKVRKELSKLVLVKWAKEKQRNKSKTHR